MIRRSQTLRTHSHRASLVPRPAGSPNSRPPTEKPLPTKPSATPPRLSDFGVLEEVVNDSFTDSLDLKKRLRDAEAELAKLRGQNAQLAQRPTQAQFDDLDKEYKALELILDGTQRENVKCMEEIKLRKDRERTLEDALKKLMGPSWAELLDITPSEPISRRASLLIESTAFVLPSFLETPLLEQSETDIDMEASQMSVAVHSTLASVPQHTAPAQQDSTLASIVSALSGLESNPTSRRPSFPGSVRPSPRPSLGPEAASSTFEAPQISVVDMERRLRACEDAIKRLMGSSGAGELSMIRDELEVEGLMGSG